MSINYGRFGALLGTISIGNSHCKFLVSRFYPTNPRLRQLAAAGDALVCYVFKKYANVYL